MPIAIILSALRKRVRAVLALEFPSGCLIPWVILGQYCAYLWNTQASLLALPLGCITSVSWRIWPFLLGVIPALTHYAEPNVISSSDSSVLVSVLAPIRRPVPGEIRFKALVIKELSDRAPPAGTKLSCAAVELPWRNATLLNEGDVVSLRGDFSPIPFTINPFSYDANLRHDGVSAKCRARFVSNSKETVGFIEEIKEVVTDKVYSVGDGLEASGLLLSLLIGARDVVTVRTEKAFREAGLSHLLVASGYQVTLMFGLVVVALRLFLVPEIIRFVLGLIASWIFVAICGFDSSVKRAGVGITLFVLFTLLSRRRDLFSVTLSTLFISLLIWPGCIFDPGFDLSFAALFGIALGDAPYRSYLYRFFSVSFYATLAASTVALLWFGDFSPVSFVLNILLPGIVSPVACIGGIGGIILSYASFDLPLQGVIYLVSILRDFIIWVSSWGISVIKVDVVWRVLIAAPCIWLLFKRLSVKLNEFEVATGID